MKKLIVANWKSNKSYDSAQEWLNTWKMELARVDDSDLEQFIFVVAPPHPLLGIVARFADMDEHTQAAVQDISPFAAGSYTGAVSVANIADWQIDYGIVGHSERRRYFDESHQDVANKVAQLLDADITPVVCIDDEYLAEQAAAIENDHLEKCVVAYEPLEAIGSGEFQPVDEVIPIVEQIKDVFGDVPVLYGGSVDAENVTDYLEVTDGVLVGGASLDANEFADLMRSCYSDTE